MKQEMCFWVPGQHNIIDMARDDGLSATFGQTLAEVQERYPDAVYGPFEDYVAAKSADQDVPVTWAEVTEERFYDMLEVLPPAWMGRGGFLVGEPWDHHARTGQPRFAAFVQRAKKFYEASRPMTVAEFKTAVINVG